MNVHVPKLPVREQPLEYTENSENMSEKCKYTFW